MAITITTAEVKRKCMITDSTHDASIASLISEMQPVLEHSIVDIYLNDTGNTGLQATLKLGMLEIVSGEFLEQLKREIGATCEISTAGLSLGEEPRTGADLIQQGATRLAPYMKAEPPMMSESLVISNTSESDTVFSTEEEAW